MQIQAKAQTLAHKAERAMAHKRYHSGSFARLHGAECNPLTCGHIQNERQHAARRLWWAAKDTAKALENNLWLVGQCRAAARDALLRGDVVAAKAAAALALKYSARL